MLVLEERTWGLGIGDWAQSTIPNPQSPSIEPSKFYIEIITISKYSFF